MTDSFFSGVVKTAILTALTSLTLCAQNTASIEGRISNSATGEGVAGVRVRFLDRHSYVYTSVTDSSGSFRLTGLDDGDYQGEFTKEGFADSRGNPYFHVSGFVPIRADAQLKPWAVLRGRVVDEDKKPVAGVRVEKEPSQIGMLDGDTVTDENGEFVFQNLAPGSYTVLARPETKIRMQDGVRLGTVAIYYPSATELAQAVRIPVRTGQNVAGIEIRLKSVPVHRISGVLLDQAGKPAGHATLKLMGRAGTVRQSIGTGMIMRGATAGSNGFIRTTSGPETYTVVGPGGAQEIARTQSHDDGTFEFAAVESGDWRVSAQTGGADDMQFGGVVSAAVAENDVEDIRFQLSPAFVPEVTTEWAGERPPEVPGRTDNAVVKVVSPQPFNLVAVEGQVRALTPEKVRNGASLNSVFPGRYRVMAGIIQAGSYVKSVMWGGRDVNGQVVELSPGAPPFRVILSAEFGKVRGTSEGAAVFLISLNAGDILRYRQVECRAGGAFEIGDVPPGDYYIVAFDHAEKNGLPPAELPAAIVPLASNVRVEAGSTASVDLRVNKWPW